MYYTYVDIHMHLFLVLFALSGSFFSGGGGPCLAFLVRQDSWQPCLGQTTNLQGSQMRRFLRLYRSSRVALMPREEEEEEEEEDASPVLKTSNLEHEKKKTKSDVNVARLTKSPKIGGEKNRL